MAFPDARIDAALARISDATLKAAIKVDVNAFHDEMTTNLVTTAGKVATDPEFVAFEDALIDLAEEDISEVVKDFTP